MALGDNLKKDEKDTGKNIRTEEREKIKGA
jgi:hypothetical protein